MASQQSSAEWLPADWTVEIKTRKSGKQDKFYVDPSGKLKFNSKPEVLRYLKGIESTKSKSTEMSTESSKRSTRTSLAAAEAQKLTESGTKGPISKNRGLNLSAVKKDDGKLRDTSVGDSMPLKEHTSEQSLEVAAVSSIKSSEDKALDQGQEKCGNEDLEQGQEKSGNKDLEQGQEKSGNKDLEQGQEKSGNKDLSTTQVVENLPEKLPLENGEKRNGKRKSQSGTRKLHDQKDSDMPRRASKRLAGIKLDPETELQVNNRAQQVAADNSSEAKGSTEKVFGNMNTTEEPAGSSEEEHKVADEKPINSPPVHLLTNPSTPEEHVRKIENDCKTSDEPRNSPLHHLPMNPSIPEEDVRKIENDCKTSEKPGSPLNLSASKDSWMDPCFDFATKTLTDTVPIGDGDSKANDNPRSCEDLWTDPCIEFAIKTLTGAIPLEDEIKVDDDSKSFQGWPFGDSWTDPCIEFAVKTLRGDIPVGGDDLVMQDSYHGQAAGSSDKNGRDTGLAAAAAAAENPQYREQALSMPKSSSGGNVNLQGLGNNAGGLQRFANAESESCSRGGRVQ